MSASLCNTGLVRGRRTTSQQAGFTLVEMAIVLAVIGMIIGAIAIGKDVQRNAEYTKIKNKFIDQWVQAYNQYYQRTGVVLGDSQTAPRFMVNGANFNTTTGTPAPGATPLSGGDMSAATSPGNICSGAIGPNMTAVGTTVTSLRNLFAQAGVRMPPGRAEGFEDRYVYLDSNGNPQEVQVCFRWNPPGVATAGQLGEGAGNVMVISGLTPDLARMLDQMIDGKPDAREGLFRQQGVANGTPNAPGAQWGANNTYGMAETPTAESSGKTQDEDQVITVVAVYKMNQ